jgi:hypothetical protein
MNIQFDNRLLKSNGLEFQNLFYRLMKEKYDNFMPTKPNGPLGDHGCDGYLRNCGMYYQVYGPEEPKKSVKNACRKIKEDFRKLNKYINTHPCFPDIKEYYFVFNNKTNASVTMEFCEVIEELSKEYPSIKFNIMDNQKLKEFFCDLDISAKKRVLEILKDELDINARMFLAKTKCEDLKWDIENLRECLSFGKILMKKLKDYDLIAPFKEDIFDDIEKYKELLSDKDFVNEGLIQAKSESLCCIQELSGLLGLYAMDIGNGFFRMKRIEKHGELPHENFETVALKLRDARADAYHSISKLLSQQSILIKELREIPH